MNYVKLIAFGLQSASRAGLNYSGAAMAGGELRRRRAMAYSRLYEQSMDVLILDCAARAAARRAGARPERASHPR